MRILAATMMVVLAAVAAPRPAAAEADDTSLVQTTGAAAAADSDAREKAIDRAFARAVDESVAALVSARVRKLHQAEIRDQVVRRARLFVARYSVRKEGTEDNGGDGATSRGQVDAWIDRGKLRQTLTGLGIELDSRGAPAPGTRARPTIMLIALANVDGTAGATFGRDGGDGGAVGRGIDRALSEYGFDVIGAAGLSAQISEAAESALPVTDEAAIELAREAGAGGAVIVGADVTSSGKVRGTALMGVAGRAAVRVLDLDTGKIIASEDVESAAYGESAGAAADKGAAALAARTVSAVGRAMERRWPAAVASATGIAVEISGSLSWAPAREIVRALEKAPGITSVEPRRFRSGSIALDVITDLPASRVAKAISGAKLESVALDVRTVGDRTVRVGVTTLATETGGIE
jgi:hypothetical protein